MPCAIVFAIVMSVTSVTAFDIFTVEIWLTLTLTFRVAMAKWKYGNSSQRVTSYLFAIVIFCPTCHHSKDIRCRDLHELDLGLYYWQMSNINIPFERQYVTSYILAIIDWCLHNIRRLRDNHVQSIQTVSIRICDLQKRGQYHELWRRWMRRLKAF